MTSAALPQRFSNLHNKKLLVTGAAGFIGGNLFQRLNDYGLDVTGTVRYPKEAANLKAQGLKPGVSDIVIAYPAGGYHGLYIEMKRVREAYAGPAAIKSAIRPTQIEWLRLMEEQGYWVAVAYGAKEFSGLVNDYMKGEQRPEAWFLTHRGPGDRPQMSAW